MIPDIVGTRGGHDPFGEYVKRADETRRYRLLSGVKWRRLTRPDPLAAPATNRAGIDHDR